VIQPAGFELSVQSGKVADRKTEALVECGETIYYEIIFRLTPMPTRRNSDTDDPLFRSFTG
jgi:hypothetical protein